MMRSLLFVPGDSLRKFGRAREGNADGLILDLEDSVALAQKDAACAATRQMLESGRGKQRLFVRVNAFETGRTLRDLAAVMPLRPDGIVLPKCTGGADVAQLAHYLDAFEAMDENTAAPAQIIGIATETAGSIHGLTTYAGASARLWGIMWGAEDLMASLGATENNVDGVFTGPFQMARNMCLTGAAAAGIVAIDTVSTRIHDPDHSTAEARAARRDGFGAKAVIHPSHVDIVNTAFTPTQAEAEWAQKVLAAFQDNPDAGVVTIDGRMIDKPHVRAAEKILAALAQ
ncbi:CoA ester lyase [Sulfitobacter sp. F26169L]|uniref:HpcH/HpaI aldolase/citrate lyase family protein n=1 Tax=Sulfitobacter sp. F26169L TaxID=2996015 RepID=UPI002260B45E|nr:CoA ester lyase [Sulfitobacter sp. F26169L]MCX7568086.1 CoA ester lyase [Sulfitobacter sp. F26169L]